MQLEVIYNASFKCLKVLFKNETEHQQDAIEIIQILIANKNAWHNKKYKKDIGKRKREKEI